MTDTDVRSPDSVPEGMKAWAGGEAAPADWDGGPVLLRDGSYWFKKVTWQHRDVYPERDAVAYTPRLTNAVKPTGEGVEITQADREAAADLIEAYWSGSDGSMMKLAQSYRAGHSQGVFVRAFARHRLATTDRRDG